MKNSSRTVRVFISSTFRDFAEERDLLIKKVFPELRRKCRERQVELIDVDLRWGITEKEAQQGKVLPICLAEIDRSRPYFIGFLGERYGWIPKPNQYDPSILKEQPWLNEHRGGKSVTELEILHGVLNNPKMAGQAFFYFRDSKWAERKGGDYLAGTEDEREKLVALKERIRKSQFPVVENYMNPEALANRIREDLWKLIDEAFPEENVPDTLAMERRRHEAYGASRLGMYLGGRKYFTKLDRAIHKTGGFKPVLITGESGGGKSALLANWMQANAAAHPETLTFVHYLGAGADAADPLKLVTRLLREISRVTGEKLQLESEPQKIFDQLPEWLARASAHAQKNQTEWLLVLDGLDKLLSLRDLRWWPGFLPQGIKLICSCLDGEVKDTALKRMKWTELGVCPLGKTDQVIFIKDFLARYRKSLTRLQLARVQSNHLSGNPLFLKTLLEELRVFGVHEQLESKITHYLNSQSIDDLFEKVLERVEQDVGKKSVCTAMEAIWASRAGLAQDELLAIAKLKPAAWATILNALDEALIESNGRIIYGHDYLRKAVEDRYGLTGKNKFKLHRRLAEWFEPQENFFSDGYLRPNVRKAYELPYQLFEASDVSRLSRALTDAEFLMCACSASQLQDILIYFDRASIFDCDAKFLEWRDFLRKHAFLIERNDASTSSHVAFLQLALESGDRHSMKHDCLVLINNMMPVDPVYLSLSKLRRGSYESAIEILNVFEADGVGVLSGDVVPINDDYFASFGFSLELFHFQEGRKFILDYPGRGYWKYSREALLKLIDKSNILELKNRIINFDKIEHEIHARKNEFISLNTSCSVHWSDPELGKRYIKLKYVNSNDMYNFYGHEDAVCGAAPCGKFRFLTWGLDNRIVLWQLNRDIQPMCQSKEEIIHTEEPNRWLLDEVNQSLLVWTYRPSLDDWGYEEDGCVSVWNYSIGEIRQAFYFTPYITELVLYEHQIKFRSTCFESYFNLKTGSKTVGISPRGQLFMAYYEPEVDQIINNPSHGKSTIEEHSQNVTTSINPFTGYAHPSNLSLLTKVKDVFVVTAKTGEVLFVKQVNKQELKKICFL
jgi:nephrocystin-3